MPSRKQIYSMLPFGKALANSRHKKALDAVLGMESFDSLKVLELMKFVYMLGKNEGQQELIDGFRKMVKSIPSQVVPGKNKRR